MHIMTKDGWKPLYDTAPVWEARHRRVAAQRTVLALAQTMPGRNDEERRTRHNAIMAAYRGLSAAQDAMVGA